MKSAARPLAIFFICVVSSWSLAGVSLALATEWSGGFPKLVQSDVLLQWNPVKGATGYNVYKSEQKDKGLKLLATVKANRYIDKGIASGKTVYYYVAPVVGGKEGERSVPGIITTVKEKVYVPLKVPSLVGGHVKELPGGKYSVGIRWEGARGTDLVGINVYRSTKKGKDYAMIGSSSSDTFEDKDVQQGEAYYYVVTAVDSQFKETKNSNEINVAIASPAKAAAVEAEKKAEPTRMRPAKLLFRIPSEPSVDRRTGEKIVPGDPQDVAVDEAVGHIYVTSYTYGGVMVYDMDGKLQFVITKDGTGGTEKFSTVKCVAVGPNGNVYITDINSPDIYVFDFTGRPVGTVHVDVSDISGGQRARNCGIKLDKDGNIYVSEPVSDSVQILDPKGRRLHQILGVRSEAEAKIEKNKQLINAPGFVTLTSDGDVVFVNGGYSKLMVYGKGGRFERTIGKQGTGAGELSYPIGLATGNKGEVLVGLAMTPNIQAFSPDGKFLYALCNDKGDGPLDASTMRGIYVDSKDRLYVAEGFNERVSVFQLEDRFIDIVPEK